MSTAAMQQGPVVLSYGMGIESTAILLRWLLEPTSRTFDLADLIVLTAQTGDEFEDTGQLVEHHILPLLRLHQVRYVQVARAGASQTSGITVLSDTRSPNSCLIAGDFALSDELLLAGTVPQYVKNRRRCSIKAKGWVLDTFIKQEFGSREFIHCLGFHTGEKERVERDRSYSTVQRQSIYPLLDWDWDREHCAAYIRQHLGVDWSKSACVYCPFSSGKRPDLIARYRQFPQGAGKALFLELVALAFNERSTLFAGGKTLRGLLEEDHNIAALEDLEQRLHTASWAIYRVRRIYRGAGLADRKTEIIRAGRREWLNQSLRSIGQNHGLQIEETFGIQRLYLTRKAQVYPCVEDMLVAAPAIVEEKSRKSFDGAWASLFPAAA